MQINEKLLPHYQTGDIVEIGGTEWESQEVLSAYITNSTKTIQFCIKLPKRLSKISTVTMQTFKVEMRGISGYINGTSGYIDYTLNSSYTINAYVANENTIKAYMTKSSAYTNVTNNTPIIIDGYIKMKLN